MDFLKEFLCQKAGNLGDLGDLPQPDLEPDACNEVLRKLTDYQPPTSQYTQPTY